MVRVWILVICIVYRYFPLIWSIIMSWRFRKLPLWLGWRMRIVAVFCCAQIAVMMRRVRSRQSWTLYYGMPSAGYASKTWALQYLILHRKLCSYCDDLKYCRSVLNGVFFQEWVCIWWCVYLILSYDFYFILTNCARYATDLNSNAS